MEHDAQHRGIAGVLYQMTKSSFRAFQLVSLLAGIILFVYLLHRTGLTTLGHYLTMMGWGFWMIIALSAVGNCVRAGSWYAAIEPSERGITFWRLMNVMLAGEAIKFMTATGPLLSEPVKAAMVRRQVPLLHGFSSVLVENLMYYLTVFVFMFAGLPVLIQLTEVPGNIKLTALILMGFLAIGVALTYLAIRHRWYVLARGLEHLNRIVSRRRIARRVDNKTAGREAESDHATANNSRIEIITSQVRIVEDNLYTFYERRRGAFYLIVSLNMSSHLINVAEIYVIMVMLELPANFLTGFLIEVVTKMINLVFFFVPTRAGVYESGNALLLQALGMTAGAGVALAIIRKLRMFVWVGYGLVVLGKMTLEKKEGGRK
jgi:hypothetical protein